MAKHRILSIVALGACLFALGVIGLGAFTRLLDAGLGCPDWPGCYGQLTVPVTSNAQQLAASQFPANPLVTYKAWAEMIHRYFVAGLSLFILTVIGLIAYYKNLRTRANVVFALVLILLLVYQILLGRWTVTLQLLPIIVTQHLLGGFFILATLWAVFLVNRHESISFSIKSSKRIFIFSLSLLGLLLLLGQISLGAWTSTNYASLSCPDFPFCYHDKSLNWQWREAFTLLTATNMNYEGGVLSDAARQTIQMTHRLGALIVTLYLFILMLLSRIVLPKFAALSKIFHAIIGLIIIQICLGMTNVLFKLPVLTAILHNLVAALLLLAFITLLFYILCAKPQYE